MSPCSYGRASAYVGGPNLLTWYGMYQLVLYGTVSAYHEVLYLSNFATMREAVLVFPIEGQPTLFVQYFNHMPNARLVASVADVRWGGPDSMVAAEYIHTSGFTICDDLLHGFGGGYLAPILRTRRTSARSPQPFTFRENMVVVIQPNVITKDERMGVQVGELARVTGSGVESLHRYPMRFIQCG